MLLEYMLPAVLGYNNVEPCLHHEGSDYFSEVVIAIPGSMSALSSAISSAIVRGFGGLNCKLLTVSPLHDGTS